MLGIDFDERNGLIEVKLSISPVLTSLNTIRPYIGTIVPLSREAAAAAHKSTGITARKEKSPLRQALLRSVARGLRPLLDPSA